MELLRGLSQELGPIYEALDDSLFLSGSEAYQGGLLFYGSVKAAAKAKAPFPMSEPARPNPQGSHSYLGETYSYLQANSSFPRVKVGEASPVP